MSFWGPVQRFLRVARRSNRGCMELDKRSLSRRVCLDRGEHHRTIGQVFNGSFQVTCGQMVGVRRLGRQIGTASRLR